MKKIIQLQYAKVSTECNLHLSDNSQSVKLYIFTKLLQFNNILQNKNTYSADKTMKPKQYCTKYDLKIN